MRMRLAAMGVLVLAAGAAAEEVEVHDSQALQTALEHAKPGTTVSIAPGSYTGGLFAVNLAGSEAAPIVVRGSDPAKPPVFSGGGAVAIHLVDAAWVTLRDLEIRGYDGNGINVDDGGSYETPSHHVILEGVTVRDTSAGGNHDGLKLSGVDHFAIRRCHVEGWGGSAIDMVGCHHGVVEDCTFVGHDPPATSTGVTAKGGSSDILIQTSFFKNAGGRAVNIGGSSDLQYFRPRGADVEARDVTVAGNRFIGSLAAVAFPTSTGGRVHHNTILNPETWILRILQESDDLRFGPSRNGVFEDNLVVYDERVSVLVNVGPGTAPETFRFRHNAWFDANGGRRLSLPVPEEGGVHQVDPRLDPPGGPTMRITSTDPRLAGIGADAYAKPKGSPGE